MRCVRKLKNQFQLVMCTYLAPGPNSLRKAVWMYPGCLHPTVEAGAPASFQKGYKSTQKLNIQQEKRSNISTNSRHSPHMSDFSYVRVMAREVFQSDSSSHFHTIMGLASFSLYPLVHVTVICGTKTVKYMVQGFILIPYCTSRLHFAL